MTLPLDTAPGPSPDEESARNWEISRHTLQQARDELAKQDLLQASEKAWCAVAYAVKAMAENRRWFSEADWKLRRIASVISDEQSDQEILHCYDTARDAHFNFYRHEYDNRDVEQAITASEYLVTQMEVALFPGYSPPYISESVSARIRVLEQPTSEHDHIRLTQGRPPMETRPPVIPREQETAPENGATRG